MRLAYIERNLILNTSEWADFFEEIFSMQSFNMDGGHFFPHSQDSVFQGHSMVNVTAEKYRAPLLLYYIFF